MLFRFLLIVVFCFGFGCAKEPRTAAPIKAKKEDPYFILMRSNLKAFEGKPDASLEDLYKAMESYPKDPYLKYQAAERYAEFHQWEKASEYIQETLRLKPDWIAAQLLRARIFEAEGYFEKGEVFLRKVLEKAPENEDAYFRLAQNLANQKKYPLAISHLRKWLRKKPESVVAYFYIATIQNIYMERPLLAIRTFNKILKLDPDNIPVRQETAQIFLKKGRLREALKVFQEISERLTDDLSVKLQIASIYQELGEVKKAIQVLDEILRINPQADRIHYFLGLLLEQEKDFHKALEHFGKVPSRSGLFKDAVLHHASIYRNQLQNPALAITVVEKSIKANRNIAELYQLLAVLWEDENKWERGAEALKLGISRFPDDVQLHFNLALLYEKMDKQDLGIRSMREVIRIDPENASALNYVGYLYVERGKHLEEAESLIRRALKARPKDPYIIDSLGWLYYQRGDWEKAYEYIRLAYEGLSTEPAIAEHMGDISLKRGEKQKAKEYFEKALKLGEKKESFKERELKRVEEKLNGLKEI